MKYQINVIRQLRLQEKKDQTQQSIVHSCVLIAFALFLMAVAYTTSRILHMNLIIENERKHLVRIETEYKKYQETRMIVEKADIELLDKLQTGRIFWTKKLAAMAYHLPNRPPNPYWITSIGYGRSIFNVKGFGFISPMQEQLITIDEYLNNLRNDTTFNDVFRECYFNETSREDEGKRERVSFDYSAVNKEVANESW